MKIRCSFLLFFIIAWTNANSQGENNFWFFGTGLGLDFNKQAITGPGGTPEVDAFNVSSFNISPSSFVAYSDSDGNLLFYSNGISVWNKNHEYMLNGSSLIEQAGGIDVSEALALPAGCGKYYLFYQANLSGLVGTLFSSIIDMNLNAGYGEIPLVTKDRVLYQAPFRALNVVPGLGFNWLIGVSSLNSETIQFHAFKVSAKGIEDPIISQITIDDLRGLSYRVEFSPTGKHAFFIQGGLLFDLLPLNILSFDTSTGIFERKTQVIPDPAPWPGYNSNIVSAQLSPDEKLIYTVERYGYCEQLECFTGFGVFQYRFDRDNYIAVEATKKLLTFYEIDEEPLGDMQLTPNNKLYLTRYNSPYLDVINFPNIQGRKCNYVEKQIEFASGRTSISLPNLVIPSDEYQFVMNENLVEPISLCDGANVVLELEACYDSILWSDLSNELTNTFTEAGEYWVRVYDGSCSYTQEFTILDYFESQDYLPQDTVLCNSEAVFIDLSAETWANDLIWENGSTNQTRTIGTEGEYFLEVNENGCIFRDSLSVKHYSLPDSVVPDDTLKCAQEDIAFSVAVFQADYDWSDGSISPLLRTEEEGLYKVTVTLDRCFVEDSVFIENRENIDFGFPDETTVCKGEVVTLNASQPGLIEHYWSNESTSSILEATEDGIYILEAKDAYCSFRDTVEILHELCIEPELYFPNIFSPNDDGYNDVFNIGIPAGLIFNSGFMQVFDRYGNRVAVVEDILEGWDGKHNGTKLRPGVYVAYVEANVEAKNGVEDIQFIVSITLVR